MKIIVLGAGKVGKTLINICQMKIMILLLLIKMQLKVEEVVNQYDVIGVVGNGSS